MIVFSILSIIIGFISAVFGVIIRRYKMVELLSVYNPKKVVDKDGLANWVGPIKSESECVGRAVSTRIMRG